MNPANETEYELQDNDEIMMESFFAGVPSEPEDLYLTIVFLGALYVVGDIFCRQCLKIVPSLVGYIVVGMAFGPQGLDLVRPTPPETWVLLGNLGLILLIVQAGLEIEYQILKQVGLRGVIIAVIGSILPISIGTGIASVFVNDWKSALAAGCSFGPTSVGIAMNVLGQCQDVLQRPVGQLIIAAAIVDDILALVVLSQLQALTTDNPTIADVIVPIVSAILWLFVGGAIALLVFPKYVMDPIFRRYPKTKAGVISLTVLLILLYVLLPATYFSQVSYLLGSFLTGLAFCRDNSTNLVDIFRQQFKRIIDWLMKIFFAATIGFQVPIRSFGDKAVVGRGFFFCLALLGKLAVGLLTPVFYDGDTKNVKRYCGEHLRDCFVVGFSMMGEAEFAFVVAVFGLSQELVAPDLYASIVWAILLSTIISPLLLRSTLAVFPYTKVDEYVDKNNSDILSVKDVELPKDLHKTNFTRRITTNGATSRNFTEESIEVLVIQMFIPNVVNTFEIMPSVYRVLLSKLRLQIVNQQTWWAKASDTRLNDMSLICDYKANNIQRMQQQDQHLVLAIAFLHNKELHQLLEYIHDALEVSISESDIQISILNRDTRSLNPRMANFLTSTNDLLSRQERDNSGSRLAPNAV